MLLKLEGVKDALPSKQNVRVVRCLEPGKERPLSKSQFYMTRLNTPWGMWTGDSLRTNKTSKIRCSGWRCGETVELEKSGRKERWSRTAKGTAASSLVKRCLLLWPLRTNTSEGSYLNQTTFFLLEAGWTHLRCALHLCTCCKYI